MSFYKFGTIGFLLADVEVAIDSPDEDGLGNYLRGPNVMMGYYEDERIQKVLMRKAGLEPVI